MCTGQKIHLGFSVRGYRNFLTNPVSRRKHWPSFLSLWKRTKLLRITGSQRPWSMTQLGISKPSSEASRATEDRQSSGPLECCWPLGFLFVCLFLTNRETCQGPLTAAVNFMEIKRAPISCSSAGLNKRDGHRIIPICLMFLWNTFPWISSEMTSRFVFREPPYPLSLELLGRSLRDENSPEKTWDPLPTRLSPRGSWVM